MSFDKVKQYFEEAGAGDRVLSFSHSSATVELAAGDVKIDNHKFKETFHQKAKMIPKDLVESYIGHAPGGVCPFMLKENVRIYLDESLKRFDIVYPAAGNASSAVRLTIPELERFSHCQEWIRVCKETV
ncbi:MAG: YbaK/EbsC family protein [Lachnospiraceae bacterium]|nr:YbaK/EbsC family protein [Lachnospiraceae bacterium]